MEKMELKEKKTIGRGILKKTWQRCKSFNHGRPVSSPSMIKSKSWSSFMPSTPPNPSRSGGSSKSNRVGLSTPKGYLSIYVGIERQRFVIKIEYTNHPLFRMLLEEAELEYGFDNDGPLVLPCDPDTFVKVLFEMEEEADDRMIRRRSGCTPITRSGCTPIASSSYRLLRPSTSFLSFVQPI